MSRTMEYNYPAGDTYSSPPGSKRLGAVKAVIPVLRRTWFDSLLKAWMVFFAYGVIGPAIVVLATMSLNLTPEVKESAFWFVAVTSWIPSAYILMRGRKQSQLESTQWSIAIYENGLQLADGLQEISFDQINAYAFYTEHDGPYVDYRISFYCGDAWENPTYQVRFQSRNFIGPLHDLNERLRFLVAEKWIRRAYSNDGFAFLPEINVREGRIELKEPKSRGKADSCRQYPFQKIELQKSRGVFFLFMAGDSNPFTQFNCGARNAFVLQTLIEASKAG